MPRSSKRRALQSSVRWPCGYKARSMGGEYEREYGKHEMHGNAGTSSRASPLCITAAQVDTALGILSQVLAERRPAKMTG